MRLQVKSQFQAWFCGILVPCTTLLLACLQPKDATRTATLMIAKRSACHLVGPNVTRSERAAPGTPEVPQREGAGSGDAFRGMVSWAGRWECDGMRVEQLYNRTSRQIARVCVVSASPLLYLCCPVAAPATSIIRRLEHGTLKQGRERNASESKDRKNKLRQGRLRRDTNRNERYSAAQNSAFIDRFLPIDH